MKIKKNWAKYEALSDLAEALEDLQARISDLEDDVRAECGKDFAKLSFAADFAECIENALGDLGWAVEKLESMASEYTD